MSNTELSTLVAAAFGGEGHPLSSWYARHLAAIPPLRAFTTAYASKIRKKARSATSSDPLRDLHCELAVAAALTADRRSPVIYEPLAAAGQRGPDFLLRHKGHTSIYIEVSRLRPAQSPERVQTERLAGMLCGKLEQLASGAANLLVLISDDGSFSDDTIRKVILGLRQRADAKDDAYFAFRGLERASLLHQTLPRLSAILAVAPAEADQTLFLYPQACHTLPADLVRAIRTWNLSASIGPLP